MGRDAQVVDVRRTRSNGKEIYRVEIEENNRSRAMYVDDTGKLVRETNTTEEGRQRVTLNDVPGEVKTSLLKAAGNDKYTRIVQATRDRQTWYAGYLPDGRIVRVDGDGKLINSDAAARDTREARDRRDDRTTDWRDSDKRKDKVEFATLPADVKEAIRRENREGHVKDIYNMEGGYYLVQYDNNREVRIGHDAKVMTSPTLLADRREARRGDRRDDRPRSRLTFNELPADVKEGIRKANGGEGHIANIWKRDDYYQVQLDSGRYFLLGKNGSLLEPHKAEMGVKDAKKIEFAALPDKVKDGAREGNRANHVEGVWQVDDRHYLCEYQDRTYVYVDKSGNIVD
jgi:hypothetical protein